MSIQLNSNKHSPQFGNRELTSIKITIPKIYELPGSNHANISGEASKDLTRKHLYVNAVSKAFTSVDVSHIKPKTEPHVTSEDYPRCFGANIESARLF